MSTPQWFAEFERQEAMREERLDNIRADMQRRNAADDNSESARRLRRLIERIEYMADAMASDREERGNPAGTPYVRSVEGVLREAIADARKS